MYAVVRNDSGRGAKNLFHLLEEHRTEVESAIRSVPGLVKLFTGRVRGRWYGGDCVPGQGRDGRERASR